MISSDWRTGACAAVDQEAQAAPHPCRSQLGRCHARPAPSRRPAMSAGSCTLGCASDQSPAEGEDGAPFFSALGAEALAYYPPAELLQALLHHREYDVEVRAVPFLRARGSNARRAPHPASVPPELAGRPPRGEDTGLPQGHEADGASSSTAMSSEMVDALLVGTGLVLPDEEQVGSRGAVTKAALGGRAVFVRGATGDPFVVWAASSKMSILSFCSCGTPSKDENVEARVRTSQSSSCRHADAYMAALRGIAEHVQCTDLRALLTSFPALDNAAANSLDVCTVEMHALDDSAALHIVGFIRIWSVVHTPAARTRKARPVCRHVPCRSRTTHCIHSCAVKPPLGGYGGFETGKGDGRDDEDDNVGSDRGGDDGMDEGDGASSDGHGPSSSSHKPPAPAVPQARHSPAAHAAKKKGQERRFSDTDHRRRARNLLPCAVETRMCPDWDSLARGAPSAGVTLEDLHESTCMRCGAAAGDLEPRTEAQLHTLSGPTPILTRSWTCANAECKATVRFDGSDLGLFAYNAETVYTRTLIDVILFTIISTKSSISAASAVSAFELHCSGSVHANDSAQTRQELSYATDQYFRTLIVPRTLYRCDDCYVCSQTPYLAVVADGETIGIFREASFPFEKDTANVPNIPISINDACAVYEPKVRVCVRQLLKAGYSAEVSFNKSEQQAMSTFESLSEVAPAFGDHSDAEHRKKAAAGAASIFWCSFFKSTSTSQGGGHDDAASEASEPPPASEPPTPPSASQPLTPPSSLSSSPRPPRMDQSPALPLHGGGAPAEAEDADAKGEAVTGFRFCKVIPRAIGGDDLLPIVRRERWSTLFNFFSAFIAEPVIGIISGCLLDSLKLLAQALIDGKKQENLQQYTTVIQSLHVIWPAIDLLADSMEDDAELARAMAELLLFAVHTDLHMELLWRSRMNAEALRFEADWTNTDAGKFRAWKERQPLPTTLRLPSGHAAVQESQPRTADQATEIISGVVMPDLDQVRPHLTNSVAAKAARAARKKKEKQKNPKKHTKRKRANMENGGLGDDDCRHAFITSSVFTPGVVSYLCSCGVLLGFEVLETAEGPARIFAVLASRAPRLPKTVHFDTACQSSRNATRRMPWLVRISETSWALDRFQAVGHKCSPLFDANNYPERSGLHKTSAAENRHSLNRPLKSHLTYLGQDRFVVQMRRISAINDLLILYRRKISKTDVHHRPLPSYFRRYMVSHCERMACDCRS